MALRAIKEKITTYGEVVMFSHTLFSLPFAVIATIWASNGLPGLGTTFWILVALISTRNGANAFNRIVDRKFDRKNPRLQDRHFVTGTVSVKEIKIFVVVNYAILIVAAYMLNPLAFALSPAVIFITAAYSYTKRFTWLCHVWLGFAIGLAPIGAWVAITGTISLEAAILGAIATLWIGGFDIIYATQDIDFDREENLYSMPARFGFKKSLYISRFFHFLIILLLFFLYVYLNLGLFYLVGVLIASALIIVQHTIIVPQNRKVMKLASYNINQVVSIVILTSTLLDFYIGKGL